MSVVSLTNEGVPVISIGPFFRGDSKDQQEVIDAITNACEDIGCFFVTDHDVDWDSVTNFFNDMTTFFKLPLEEKMKYDKSGVVKNRGYSPLESQNVHAYMGRPGYPNDPLEKFVFGSGKECPLVGESREKLEKIWCPNIYPDYPVTIKESAHNYLESITTLSEKIMKILSKALSMPDDFILNFCNEAAHWLKINFYPKTKPKPGQDRFGEHTDSTPFTVVYPDPQHNGLMIKNKIGDWVPVIPPPKTFFINLGELMSIFTNGKWIATKHKVIFPEEEDIEDRMSFVLFIQVNHDTILETIPSCLDSDGKSKYTPMSFEDYTAAKVKRLAEANIY